MAKAAKKAPEPSREDSILATLAAQNPPPEPEAKPSVDTDALLQRIAALESGLERANQTNMALMTQPPAPAYSQPAPSHPGGSGGRPQMQYGPLPDPVTDTEGFNQALMDRISGTIGAALQAQQTIQAQKSQEDARADELWERFEQQYPDLAGNKRLVGLSAADVATDMRNRGINLDRYMQVAGDEFLKNVADRMKKDWGPMVGDGGSAGAPAAPVHRTAGVFGGAEGIGTNQGKPAEVELGSMTEDLHKLQLKDGYY